MFYVYDGTFEGFLSALTEVMRTENTSRQAHRNFFVILKDSSALPLLDYRFVTNIPGIIDSFGRYIDSNFGPAMLKSIYHAYLSEIEGIENSIAEFIFLARMLRIDPIDRLYESSVKAVASAIKKVTMESHRYLGLLRFRKLSFSRDFHKNLPGGFGAVAERFDCFPSEVFISEIEPVTFCLPLIVEHFVERLPNQAFIIMDKKRKVCCVHLFGDSWTLLEYDESFEKEYQFENAFENLWQQYYKTLSIPERENPKLQMGIMPKRFWKYLIEKPGRQ